jgi:ABC-type proline/glycine betaine transport system substrate-binding protein
MQKMTTTRQAIRRGMRGMTTLAMVVAMLAGSFAMVGCHSAPGKDKKMGTYYQNIAGSRDLVAEAARQVMGEMGYLRDSDEVNAGVTTLRYRTAFDTKIIVTIDPASPDYARVGVLVTPGHSEGLSQNVLKRIEQRVAGVR